MTPRFHPRLVNGPSDDPLLYVDFLFERRALLFDLGDVRLLPPRKILRISHIFVSHTHMDHFVGFDPLLRLFLGREKRLRLFGPPGFIGQLEHRLASYTWNLVERYPGDFTLLAHELHPEGVRISAEFHCRHGFRREGEREEEFRDGVILEEETFRVRTSFLDHGTISLAFALEETRHVNIMKNRLAELGLPTGPWLAELKRQVLAGAADVTPVRAWWRENGRLVERLFSLGELRTRAVRVVPGQKIVYVSDAAPTEENGELIVALARGADQLFIETPFLEADRHLAGARSHLTARFAGSLARRAGVERVIPLHFSPRYQGREHELQEELGRAFRGAG